MSGLEAGGSWLEGAVDWRYSPWTGDPDPSLVGGVDLVAFCGDGVVVVAADGGLMRPGGTSEAGERWIETAARELMEEAGGRIVDIAPFGLLTCRWQRRPSWLPDHLPYPDFVRVVAWCEVTLDATPTSPAAAEQITEVLCLPPAEAVSRLRAIGNDHHADLVEAGLAAHQG